MFPDFSWFHCNNYSSKDYGCETIKLFLAKQTWQNRKCSPFSLPQGHLYHLTFNKWMCYLKLWPTCCCDFSVCKHLGTVHKHLLVEFGIKRGPLNLTLVSRSTEKKIAKIFQWKLSLYAFLWGWPLIFMAKRRGRNFEVRSGGRGGPQIIFMVKIFASYPPNKCYPL